MRIVSWNVHRCIGTDGQYRPERIVEVLRHLEADVIALQEVDSSLRSPEGSDQLSFIARKMGMESQMGPTLARDYGAYGNALLSRYPITDVQETDLSYRKFEPRGALSATLVGPDFRLRIVNTHLGLKYWERSFQIQRVLKAFAREEAAILVGDFNEWFPYTRNSIRLRRLFPSVPRLATFPSTWPQFALDRIYFGQALENLSYSVYRSAQTKLASDHLPVLADFRWSNSQ